MNPSAPNSLELEALPETGAPPSRRLKEAKTAREIYALLKDADKSNAQTRARVQAMFDGSPPYDPKQLEASQQYYRCNLNFGEAESLLDYAMSGYIDLLNSVEDLVVTPTLFGEETERDYFSIVLSREISRTLREWPQFTFNYMHLCTEFLAHGLGIGHFEDQHDWRYRACGQQDFFIPRGTLASEDELEMAASRRVYPIHEIWSKIKDPAAAAESGWNVAATRKALTNALGHSTATQFEYEKLETDLKNNDYLSTARATTITLIHMWVKEFDGTVTHVMFPEADTGFEFLYEQAGYLGSMQQGFVMFPYGLGTNSHYHGIRGLGYKIFPAIQVSNRLRSHLVDGAMLASSVMLQPGSEADFTNMALTYYGTYAVIAPGMQVVDRSIPNFQQSVMPVLADMGQQLQNRTGQYNTQSLFGGGQERTRYEVSAHLESAAKLSLTSLNLFYQPWDRLLREVVRRMTRPNYLPEEPGGEAIAFLRYRLELAGIPPEAFSQIDLGNVRAVRAMGAGSPAARTGALRDLQAVMGSFDPVGQHNLLRDFTVTTVGAAQSDRYIKRDPGPRVPMDAKIALLENDALEEGKEIEVLPEEMHMVHLDKHLTALAKYLDQEKQGAPIEELVPRLSGLYYHAFDHLQFIQGDKTLQDQVAAYRQALQQAGEIIANGEKRIAALQRQAQEQSQADAESGAMEGGMPAPQGPPPEEQRMQAKLQEHQLRLQMMQETHQLKQNMRIQDSALNRSLKDADHAASLYKKIQ